MNPRDYRLFKQYPLNGKVVLSTGDAPTPYHIYSGYGALIGGTADLAAVQHLLQGEGVVPVQTTAGQALMGIWVCDFTDASLGPHHELQFSIFVSRTGVRDIAPKPLSLIAVMLTRPDVQMLCHGLWNNTPVVVAYNRELLSLNACLSDSTIMRDASALQFRITDHASGMRILAGKLSQPRQASWRANFALLAQLGPARMQRVMQQPWVTMQIVNPASGALARNVVAQAFTKNDANILRYFNPGMDSLAFGDTPYAQLQFKPQFVQHMDGFKFVYLNPE